MIWLLTFAFRVLLTTDKGPDCPLFSIKPVFKALNIIVSLFSSDNVIKFASLGVILTARRFKCHISLVIYCKTHVCHVPSVVNDLFSQIYAPLITRQHTMLLMRALEKQLQVFTDMIQPWSSYDLRPNIIPANFF